MDEDLLRLARATETAFEAVHDRAFRGDPAANPRLTVEVLEAARVGDAATLVLIAPWTLNGLVFLEDVRFPDTLAIGPRTVPVFTNELPGIGTYRSVNLIPDVSGFSSPGEARRSARMLAGLFRDAVARARAETSVADPARREIFRRLVSGGGTSP